MVHLVEDLFRGHYAIEASNLGPSAPAAGTFQADSPAELLECTLVAAIVAAEALGPVGGPSTKDLWRILCEAPCQFVARNVYRYIGRAKYGETWWKEDMDKWWVT